MKLRDGSRLGAWRTGNLPHGDEREDLFAKMLMELSVFT